jgi:hypothetical protein
MVWIALNTVRQRHTTFGGWQERVDSGLGETCCAYFDAKECGGKCESKCGSLGVMSLISAQMGNVGTGFELKRETWEQVLDSKGEYGARF